jgi:hypothetical protein
MPPPVTPFPPAGYPDDYLARCSRVATEHATQSSGGGFTGSPHYFGDNEDTTRRYKNLAELKRRRAAGYCFKCRMSDVKAVPFIECPLHGALATATNAPMIVRTRVTRAQKRP